MNIILKGANLQQIKTERQRYLKKLFTTIHMLKERIRRMKMRNRNISFSKFEKKLQEEGNKGSRTFFKLTSRTRVSQYPDSLNGKVFDDEIEEEITEEYQNIYSKPPRVFNIDDKSNIFGNSSITQNISKEEIISSIKSIKSNKAPGTDQITNNIIKLT